MKASSNLYAHPDIETRCDQILSLIEKLEKIIELSDDLDLRILQELVLYYIPTWHRMAMLDPSKSSIIDSHINAISRQIDEIAERAENCWQVQLSADELISFSEDGLFLIENGWIVSPLGAVSLIFGTITMFS